MRPLAARLIAAALIAWTVVLALLFATAVS